MARYTERARDKLRPDTTLLQEVTPLNFVGQVQFL